MDELTLLDYLTKPARELAQHETYSKHAHRVVLALMDLTTTQLENIDIPGVFNAE